MKTYTNVQMFVNCCIWFVAITLNNSFYIWMLNKVLHLFLLLNNNHYLLVVKALIASFGFSGETNATKMQTTRDRPFNCKHPRNTKWSSRSKVWMCILTRCLSFAFHLLFKGSFWKAMIHNGSCDMMIKILYQFIKNENILRGQKLELLNVVKVFPPY